MVASDTDIRFAGNGKVSSIAIGAGAGTADK
jgi:hypothetical protein